ncbi:hypothetical protein GC175_22710 [bacterium]|nr:hypothetical protein [bacterium]
MKEPTSKFMHWLPWGALVILGGLCTLVLLREATGNADSLVGTIVGFMGALIVFLALALAVESVEQEVEHGKMERWLRRLLYWTPRSVSILFALFLSLFALDVFGAGYSPLEVTVALLIHLVPTFVLLAATALAWRWEWIGAVVFAGWAIWYTVVAWGAFPFSVYLLMVLLPLTVGLLFSLNWLFRQEIRSAVIQ